MRLLPLGRFAASDKTGFWSLDWNGVLGRLSNAESAGLPPEEKDLRRRAIGLVLALDHALVGELPIEVDQGMISYPDKYFPRATVLPQRILDPAAFEEKLHVLIAGDLSELAAKLPRVHKHPEAVDGLRARALLLLGSNSTSARTMEVLRAAYADGPPQVRGAAAAALAFAGHEDAMRDVLMGDGDPAAKTQLLAALTRDGGKAWMRVEGERVHSAWSSGTDVGRLLDSTVVDLSYRDPDPAVRRAATLALVARQDNPHVLAAIVNHLDRSTDPLLTFDVLDAGLLYHGSPALGTFLVRQLDSPNPFLRNIALFRAGGLPDPAVIDRIIPFLDHAQGGVRRIALASVASAGRLQPDKAIAAMRAAVARHPEDKGFPAEVEYRISELLRPGTGIESAREWLRKHPDHELR